MQRLKDNRVTMVFLALRQVFSKPLYVLLAAITGLATFVLTTWLANLSLVWQVVTSEWVTLADKITILIALVGSIGTNFTYLSAGSAVAIAILFGMNVAVFVYDYQFRGRHIAQAQNGAIAASLGGLGSGLFGIGCAACGTFILSPALTFIGASSLVAMLPLGGDEFGVLGVAILSVSLVLGVRKIAQPVTCLIPSAAREKRFTAIP